jgi:osomolarity two-component system sensor histidine kinase NIK1
MQGNMWVDSEVGAGSAFFFTITTSIAPLPDEGIDEKIATYNGRTILLVDTFKDKTGVADMLKSRDFTTYRVEDVVAAQKKDTFPQLNTIIVDSIAATEMLRSIEYLRYIPVVLLTGPSTPLNLKWCLDNSIFAHSLLPTSTSDLITALASALESGVGAPSVAPSDVKFDILLAEDNQVNQKLAVKLLERYGYLIEIAENGSLAVETFKERIGQGKPFDIILVSGSVGQDEVVID